MHERQNFLGKEGVRRGCAEGVRDPGEGENPWSAASK